MIKRIKKELYEIENKKNFSNKKKEKNYMIVLSNW